MVTFAKAVTSAYIPLSGAIVSKDMHKAILEAPPDARFMHGYTNSAHPAACAVGLRNLQIFDDEGLVENAARMGERLQAGLRSLMEEDGVGEVRGLGLIGGGRAVGRPREAQAVPRRAQRRRPADCGLPRARPDQPQPQRQLSPGAAARHQRRSGGRDYRDSAGVDPGGRGLGAEAEAGGVGVQSISRWSLNGTKAMSTRTSSTMSTTGKSKKRSSTRTRSSVFKGLRVENSVESC